MNLPVNIPILDIEIVRGCFLECRWCTLDKSEPYRIMSLELFRKIIDAAEASGAGYSRLLLFRGGEPFLHPDINGLLKIIEEKEAFRNITVEFYNNAMAISRQQAASVMNSPLNAEVIFSVDGIGDGASFEYMRPGAKWEKLLDTVSMVSELRKQSPYRSHKKISLSTIIPDQASVPFYVPSEEKVHNCLSMQFKGCGVDEFYYRGIHRWTGKTVTDGMPAADTSRQGPCYFIKRGGISVMVDGRVSPCCADIENDLLVGDLNRESVTEIFYGRKLTEMREMMLKGQRCKIQGCNTCDLI